MHVTRREFLKISGMASALGALAGLGFDVLPIKSYAAGLETMSVKETTSICPYCAVGCGQIVQTDTATGKIINTEGDSDHP
ncbi:MAG: twin-arginine translocation signal domain-containing protein, partial [Deltaproteobacteria bacterium]|nr:twin-arginine translocation signal domain-containing protein [Deltaproteobacteria bacterium]